MTATAVHKDTVRHPAAPHCHFKTINKARLAFFSSSLNSFHILTNFLSCEPATVWIHHAHFQLLIIKKMFPPPSYISLWWLRYTGLTVMWLNQIKSTNWVTFAIMITAAEATPKRFYRMFRCSLKQFAAQKSDWGCVWTLIKNLIKCVADCLCYPDGDTENNGR